MSPPSDLTPPLIPFHPPPLSSPDSQVVVIPEAPTILAENLKCDDPKCVAGGGEDSCSKPVSVFVFDDDSQVALQGGDSHLTLPLMSRQSSIALPLDFPLPPEPDTVSQPDSNQDDGET